MAVCFFSLVLIAMQIIVITKSTIPTDDVILEIRILRNERIARDVIINRRLSDIQAMLGNELARQETLQYMEHPDGIGSN